MTARETGKTPGVLILIKGIYLRSAPEELQSEKALRPLRTFLHAMT